MKIDGLVEDPICTFSEGEVGKFTSYTFDLAAGQSVQTIHSTVPCYGGEWDKGLEEKG